MITIKTILSLNISILELHGNQNQKIDKLLQLTDANFNDNSLAWCSDKNMDLLLEISEGTIILSEPAFSFVQEKHSNHNNLNWIVVKKPRSFFSHVLSAFFIKPPVSGII